MDTRIYEWDNISDCDKLSALFTELPRGLGKYVKKLIYVTQTNYF